MYCSVLVGDRGAVFWPRFEQRLLGSGEAIGQDAHSGIVKLRGSPSLGSVAEIAILVFRILPRGSGSSRECGRGVGEENLEVSRAPCDTSHPEE